MLQNGSDAGRNKLVTSGAYCVNTHLAKLEALVVKSQDSCTHIL